MYKATLEDYRGEEIKFTDIDNDEFFEAFKEELKLEEGDFEALWESYDERNSNSYNASFLGRDFIVKYLDNRIYVAIHRAGDIRGNYTDFLDITDCFEEAIERLETVMAFITIEIGGSVYRSESYSSYGDFDFEPIVENGVELFSREVLEYIWDHWE